MVVVSISSGKEPYATTITALRNLLESGVSIPKISVIKPNAFSTHKNHCRNTNPRVCEAVADFFSSQGSKEIICAEGSSHGNPPDTFQSFANHGYFEMRKKISRYVDLNKEEPGKWIKIVSPGVDYGIELGIAETAVRKPVVSVAKFKTHDVLGLTLTMKNMLGCLCRARRVDTKEILTVGGGTKCYMHGWGGKKPKDLTEEQNIGPSKIALAKNIVKLLSCIMPSFGVLDGVIAMEGNGPLFGTSKNLGVVIAGADPVACDVVACEIAGFSAVETGYIYAAGRLGLGEYRLEEIEIVGEEIMDVKNPLKPHRRFHSAKFSEDSAEKLIEEIREVL